MDEKGEQQIDEKCPQSAYQELAARMWERNPPAEETCSAGVKKPGGEGGIEVDRRWGDLTDSVSLGLDTEREGTRTGDNS